MNMHTTISKYMNKSHFNSDPESRKLEVIRGGMHNMSSRYFLLTRVLVFVSCVCIFMGFVILCGDVHIGYMGNDTKL